MRYGPPIFQKSGPGKEAFAGGFRWTLRALPKIWGGLRFTKTFQLFGRNSVAAMRLTL